MFKGVLFGILTTIALGALVIYITVANGLIPANADAGLLPGERWAAYKSLHATLQREAPHGANPLAPTDANLISGIKLYGENCSVCHGASNARASTIAQGLYQRAPQLAGHGVEDDRPGVTFWKLKHGIRFTGMPAFGAQLSDTQLWQIALFLKEMDRLPAAPKRLWLTMKNPAQISPVQPRPRHRERGGRHERR